MLNRNLSAGTAAQKSSKCSLIQRPAIILAMLLLVAVRVSSQTLTEKMFGHPKETIINGHRLHVLGMTYTTYPPFYSCVFCAHECSPYNFLSGIKQVDSVYRKYGDASDSVFMAWWNKKDTSCISNEIALNKSRDVWGTWMASHKPGKYYLDKTVAMHTSGFISHYDEKGEFIMGYGGRFNDSTIMADKWYKVVFDKPEKKRRK